METTISQTVSLEAIQVHNLPELQGWKEKQLAIVEENPFVTIEDNTSYEVAKKHRTSLVSARTDIQKQDKLIASKLKEIRSEAARIAEELIAITQPHEEKQQEEVKRYEAQKELERQEKERLEQERKEKILSEINLLYNHWKAEIIKADFQSLDLVDQQMSEALDAQSEKDMEEFELDFAEKANLLQDQLRERRSFLTEREEARVAAEKLAKERELFEKAQKEAEEKARLEAAAKAEDERKRNEAREAEEAKFRAEKEAFEAEKRKLAEAEEKRQAAIAAEQKAKEEAEAKAKAEAEEKARDAAEKKRLKALQPDKEKAEAVIRSLTIDYSPEVTFKEEAVNVLVGNFIEQADLLRNDFLKALSQIK